MPGYIESRVSGGTVSPLTRLIEGGRRYTRAACLARAYTTVAALRLRVWCSNSRKISQIGNLDFKALIKEP